MEGRRFARHRTRLRSGKLVSLVGQFLTDCQFHDVSGGGARVRLLGGETVAKRFWLFDDQYGQALLTEVAWQKGAEIGVRFIHDPAVPLLDEKRLAELSGKYYAMKCEQAGK
ncbi:MAG: PilZ domain-containing protein [Phyllobacterium sp.]